jgi:hypothetical protein
VVINPHLGKDAVLSKEAEALQEDPVRSEVFEPVLGCSPGINRLGREASEVHEVLRRDLRQRWSLSKAGSVKMANTCVDSGDVLT